MERMIEVCAGSYQDCIAAYQGSAKRVELNSALSVGGLTPSVACLIRVKKETSPLHICSKQGYSKSVPIICLPNKIIIKLVNDNEYDAISK